MNDLLPSSQPAPSTYLQRPVLATHVMLRGRIGRWQDEDVFLLASSLVKMPTNQCQAIDMMKSFYANSHFSCWYGGEVIYQHYFDFTNFYRKCRWNSDFTCCLLHDNTNATMIQHTTFQPIASKGQGCLKYGVEWRSKFRCTLVWNKSKISQLPCIAQGEECENVETVQICRPCFRPI